MFQFYIFFWFFSYWLILTTINFKSFNSMTKNESLYFFLAKFIKSTKMHFNHYKLCKYCKVINFHFDVKKLKIKIISFCFKKNLECHFLYILVEKDDRRGTMVVIIVWDNINYYILGGRIDLNSSRDTMFYLATTLKFESLFFKSIYDIYWIVSYYKWSGILVQYCN